MENRYGVIEKVQITVLMEENAGYDSGLLGQHGVSFLLEAKNEKHERTILFDTGQSAKPILHNMNLLHKDPGGIDMVFLSHCHSDHTGGLVGMLKACRRPRVPVIAHPGIYRDNIGIKPGFRSYGMGPGSSPAAIAKAGGEMILVAEPLPLAPGIVTTGEIKERVSLEKSPTLSTFTLKEGVMAPDLMADDISLVLILKEGLVIVTGCSHAGIVSITEAAVRLTGVSEIVALIGGFHLIDSNEQRIDQTIEELAAMSIGTIYTGHCTGFKAEAKMLKKFGSRFKKLHTGMAISF